MLALLCLLAVLIRLRMGETKPDVPPSGENGTVSAPADSVQSPASVVPPIAVAETPAPLRPTPFPTPDPARYRPIVYDARSYQLVSDMVFAYRYQVQNRSSLIAADVEALRAHDERLGEAWGGIMDYWDYANSRMEINFDRLPEDLPGDDSLCIVVLGFQLEPDGSMAPELLGRCELALSAAEQYPNAFLLLAGGGTAREHPEITEAGAMADWFRARGVPEARLIVEDRSTTTEENAMNALQILTEHYPQVKSLAIVTSDYHLPLSCLMFTETALLYRCEYDFMPYTVVANLGLRGYGLNEYKNPDEQAKYVWAVANPDARRG
jgi:hypothetical protein